MRPVLALPAADECPLCTHVHGQPTDWPTCPTHGHLLRELWVTEDGWLYDCPTCYHTHTQRERATMTATNEAATAALAIRAGQQEWDGKQLAALAQLGVEGAPNGDLEVFFHYCQATGLDPFAKQIRLRKDRHKVNGEWQESWSIETEIDGYRVIAHRAATRAGVTLSYGPMVWYDRAGGEHKIWLGDEPPAGAALTVYKDGAPFPATVRFKSFAKFTSAGQLMAQWATMPDHMIAKCAEAQALRKAFPHDLEGIRISEERAPTAPQVTVQPEAPAARRNPPRQDTRTPDSAPALRTAIGKQFDRLNLVDSDERKTYVYKLAGKDQDQALTEHDLRFALSSLNDCADIAELQELCAPVDAA